MTSLLLSKEALQELIASSDPNSESIKVTVRKLVKPKPHGATHIVVVPIKSHEESRNPFKIVGTGIKEEQTIKEGSADQFFMLFAEGGGAPAIQHPTLPGAQQAGLSMRELHNKKMYVLKAIQVINDPATSDTAVEQSQELPAETITTEDVVKSRKRKRIAPKPQKLTSGKNNNIQQGSGQPENKAGRREI